MRNRGFTLVEMLVAIFIALIIFTIAFQTLTGVIAARREADTRIRSAENARLLFQMLEKDLAGAYPVSGACDITTMDTTAPLAMTVDYKPVNVPGTDRIDMMTRSDTRSVTDQYVFVRYFVNTSGHLCREVSTSNTTPANAIPSSFDNTDSSWAVFDHVFALQLSPMQWNETTKGLVVAGGYNAQTTHVQATLYMYGYSGSTLAVDNQPANKRVFTKVIPVPDVFRGQKQGATPQYFTAEVY